LIIKYVQKQKIYVRKIIYQMPNLALIQIFNVMKRRENISKIFSSSSSSLVTPKNFSSSSSSSLVSPDFFPRPRLRLRPSSLLIFFPRPRLRLSSDEDEDEDEDERRDEFPTLLPSNLWHFLLWMVPAALLTLKFFVCANFTFKKLFYLNLCSSMNFLYLIKKNKKVSHSVSGQYDSRQSDRTIRQDNPTVWTIRQKFQFGAKRRG
jgi:hypothetical protein